METNTPNKQEQQTSYSFFTRLSMAFKIIFSGSYTQSLFNPQPVSQEEETAPAIDLKESDEDSALQLLALMQKEGRLIDFINEDVNQFSDEQVAAAARVVHQGVKKTLGDHVKFEAVSDVGEGNSVNLDENFDRSAYQLTGNVSGSAPYNGTLVHKGWKVSELTLPAVVEGTDLKVVAPAEVEL